MHFTCTNLNLFTSHENDIHSNIEFGILKSLGSVLQSLPPHTDSLTLPDAFPTSGQLARMQLH